MPDRRHEAVRGNHVSGDEGLSRRSLRWVVLGLFLVVVVDASSAVLGVSLQKYSLHSRCLEQKLILRAACLSSIC